MSRRYREASRSIGDISRRVALALISSTFIAMQARAAVEMRVEGRPLEEPIRVFLNVTDDVSGAPVQGLAASDFRPVRIDGQEILIQDDDVSLPPAQDPDSQKVSVVFAMDMSSSVTGQFLPAMQDAVISFLNSMNNGDMAAIVKFNDTNPLRASVVQPFVAIDGGPNSQALIDAVVADYPGDGSNIFDGVAVSLTHFAAPPAPLPEGPKAVILISDGAENNSTSTQEEVTALAAAESMPLFTIGVGNMTVPRRIEIMTELAVDTGGEFFQAPTDQDIADAYATVAARLSNEYLLTIPSAITDCLPHQLEVTVTGNPTAEASFTRRTCDTSPDPFSFASQTGVRTSANVTSNAVEIMGIEVPAHISVIQGRYSIGCTGDFTGSPGTISPNETVCLRHETSSEASTSTTTTLTIGGVAGTFTSTTAAASGGGGGGGGGGTLGLLEIVFLGGFVLLLLGRRRTA